MRFLELNLIAFGPFSNVRIDLSGGTHGLHLIYGPNEAGKSSSLRAITDFLFGIPTRTLDNFVHPYSQLRIGATLQHSDGSTLKAVRRKAHQKALRLEDDDTAVDEQELGRFHGDIDREFFTTMFGINHDRLRSGGLEIATGQGRLGELLFAAGAGLVNLQAVQQSLSADIDRLLKPSGRSGAVFDELSELKVLKKEVAQSQTSVETWKQHLAVYESADRRKLELDQELGRHRGELERLTRIDKSLIAIGLWKTQQEICQSMSKVPRLDDDFARRATKLMTELKQAESQQADASQTLRQIETSLNQIHVSTELLAVADLIEDLRDRFGHYRKSLQDRPGVVAKRDLQDSETLQVLRDLDRPADLNEVDQLRIPADRKTKIHQLGLQQERLAERLRTEQKTVQKLQLQIEAGQSQLQGFPPVEEIGPAKTTLQSVMKLGDLDGSLSETEQSLAKLQTRINLALRQLPVWQGDLTDLEGLAIPAPATVDRFEEKFASAQQTLVTLGVQLNDEQEKLARLLQQLNELETSRAVPTQQDLAQSRQTREMGWRIIRALWKSEVISPAREQAFLHQFPSLETLEEAYAHSVREADSVADRLRLDAERVALKATLIADRQRSETKLQHLEQTIAQVVENVASIDNDWQLAWQPLGIRPLSPTEMHDWLRHYQSILALGSQLRELYQRKEQLESTTSQARAKIVAALKSISNFRIDQLSLADLTQQLAHHCEEHQRISQAREQIAKELSENRQALKEAELEIASSKCEAERLTEIWREEMAFLGLEPTALSSQANARLTVIGDLIERKKEADRFRQRVEHIDRDAAQFENDVAHLCQRLAPESRELPPTEQFAFLLKKFESNRESANRKQALNDHRHELQRKHDLAQTQFTETHGQLNQMMLQANVMAIDHLGDAARKSYERTVAEVKLCEAEQQIANFTAGATLTEFLTEVDAERKQAQPLCFRIDELNQAIQQVSEERDQVLGQIKAAEIALREFDGNNQAAEKNALVESTQARLEEQLHSLAVLKLSAAVLAAGIERHREKHQGPVLHRASQIFYEITLQQYLGLRAEYNERGEPIVMGVRQVPSRDESLFETELSSERPVAIDSSLLVPVEGMSDGTCDQLYLALRLASLEAWLKHHEPVPLIVDDILLNFDDERSLATLKILSQLSHYTQVIFFTHHQHLIELAQDHLSSAHLFVNRFDTKQASLRLFS